MEKDYRKFAAIFKALSDETRVRIFDMLTHRELCACKILEEFDITQPTLSYHMKILCESKLVDYRRDGVWIRYSINRNTLEVTKGLFDKIYKHQR